MGLISNQILCEIGPQALWLANLQLQSKDRLIDILPFHFHASAPATVKANRKGPLILADHQVMQIQCNKIIYETL